MKALKYILEISGLVLIIGTAGASDIDQLNITQTVIRLAAGLGMFYLGTTIKPKRKRGKVEK